MQRQPEDRFANQVTRFDLVQMLHRMAKDFLAGEKAAKPLYFGGNELVSMVERILEHYTLTLERFTSSIQFSSTTSGNAQAVEEGIYYILIEILVCYLIRVYSYRIF